MRGRGGRLIEVRVTWLAEAEHGAGATPVVVRAVAEDPDVAWDALAALARDAAQAGTK